ncbi:MAG: spore coat protein [Oscillospiraceae bacterium]|nr:spore coat protein [Oscillospiraceae bacterium]
MPHLTQKELSAIEDSLNEEQLLIKKFRNYACAAQDQQIKTAAEQLANRHKQHYETLMGHLY